MYKDPDQRQVFQWQQNIVFNKERVDKVVFLPGAIITDTDFTQ